MRFIIPIFLALIGLGGGVGAALFLVPDAAPVPPDIACSCPPIEDAGHDGPKPVPSLNSADGHAEEEPSAFDYVKLNNQFVVPVVKDGRVASLVAMSLSVEVAPGTREQVFTREPKLRDRFLQVLFEHANTGGFDGNFTAHSNMSLLRENLTYAAQSILGDAVSDILIQDIARQDS